MKPVLFVTNHVPPERVGAFAALHRRVPLELALFGGRSIHATAGVADPGVPHRLVQQREIAGLAASRRYGAVVCGTAGRVALPAAFAGARARGTPFVLWSALWAHPRTPAHLVAGAPLMATLYRAADAVVAYGPHVAAFARARGARNVHLAPQAVDNAFWGAQVSPERRSSFLAVFLGRPTRAKGARCCSMPGVSQAPTHQPPRSSSSVREPGPLGSPPAARWPSSGRSRPTRSATSWPPQTFASYRPSGPAASASPGGSSPTKP